jgi:hypothetical protein
MKVATSAEKNEVLSHLARVEPRECNWEVRVRSVDRGGWGEESGRKGGSFNRPSQYSLSGQYSILVNTIILSYVIINVFSTAPENVP